MPTGATREECTILPLRRLARGYLASGCAALAAAAVASCGSSHPSALTVAANRCRAGQPPETAGSTYPNGISPSWLSQQAAQWSSAPATPLLLSPTLLTDSYDNPGQPGTTEAVIDEDLAMLEDTGAQGITIDLGYDPWISGDAATIALDDAVIAKIRSSGRLVVLKDASAERYRNSPLAWNQFAAVWVQRVRTIAARYHPDYYTVIKEPPWYAPMIANLSSSDLSSPADRQVLDPNSWTTLLTQLVAAVHEVSPSTKIGISVDANLYRGNPGDGVDLALMTRAASISGIDFLGFDIYTASAFCDTLRFLSATDLAGRAVWIDEAWSTTAPTSSNAQQPSVDAQWAPVLLDFGRTIGAQGINPFFTDYFASYLPRPGNSSDLLTYFRGRTPVFRAFQSYERACPAIASAPAVSAPC